MDECQSCVRLQELKRLSQRRSDTPDHIRFRSIYRAAIVQDTYRLDLGPKHHAGRFTSRPGPLRYCPECGKKVTP